MDISTYLTSFWGDSVPAGRRRLVDADLDERAWSAVLSSYTGKEDDSAYEFRQLFVLSFRST